MGYLCFAGRLPGGGAVVFDGTRSAETAARRAREGRTFAEVRRGGNCKFRTVGGLAPWADSTASLATCHARPDAGSFPRMDKLEEIFQMQDALNRRIGVNLPPPTDEEKAKWILNYTRALQQETAELIDSVPWKWWAKYQKFDEQNAKVEVVDLFHFLVSLAQTLGMTAEDVYQAYLKKNAVNHKRQESGYVKKDEADSKHI
jgi:dimeric dUTPase (all-alpha-NTP-PPase superfamily)